jgi:hypothetical protein
VASRILSLSSNPGITVAGRIEAYTLSDDGALALRGGTPKSPALMLIDSAGDPIPYTTKATAKHPEKRTSDWRPGTTIRADAVRAAFVAGGNDPAHLKSGDPHFVAFMDRIIAHGKAFGLSAIYLWPSTVKASAVGITDADRATAAAEVKAAIAAAQAEAAEAAEAAAAEAAAAAAAAAEAATAAAAATAS